MGYCIKCDRCGEVSGGDKFVDGLAIFLYEDPRERYAVHGVEKPKLLCKWCAKAFEEFLGG